MGIGTYETLYDMYVVPIINYGSGVWGFCDFRDPEVLVNRLQRFYLGIHKFAPVAATHIELPGWTFTT